MKLAWNLFIAQVWRSRVRFILTIVAIIAAVSVVLWIVSAYESIASQFDDQTAEFIGNYSAFIIASNADESFSDVLIGDLLDSPAIEVVNPVAQFRMRFRRVEEAHAGTGTSETASSPRRGERGLGRMGPSVVGTNSHEPRYELIDGRWLDPDIPTETVVSSGVAEALRIQPGDKIEFLTESGNPFRSTVVGITRQVEGVEFAMTRTKGGAPGGTNRGPASLAAYVPMSIVEHLTGKPSEPTLLELRFQSDASAADLDRLEQSLVEYRPRMELLRAEDIHNKIANGFEAEGARKQAYFVTALSVLASAFIIFTTLSMGVNEKSRQLAVLRAVGLRRSQVAFVVAIEAVALALLGWVGGLAGGWTLLKVLVLATPGSFPHGLPLGSTGVILTAICALLGAFFASLLPMWRATRISPLEALSPPVTTPQRPSWYLILGVLGLFLVAINPALVFLGGIPEQPRFFLVLIIGVPTTVAGFVLLAPLVIVAVENLFGPLVARLLKLQDGLVKAQLSSNMWKSAGITVSLTLGLGLFTATQIWGWSMLGGFLPGQWTPNTIVKFSPPLSDTASRDIQRILKSDTSFLLPIVVDQVGIAGDPLKSRERDSAVRQENVVLVGLDIETGFCGDNLPFDLQFVDGDRGQALAKLKSGRHCLVPDSFLTIAGLGVGDQIGLIPNKPDAEPINYVIAGVIAEPGVNWITKTSGMRKHSVRTAGLVFAPHQAVQTDFQLPKSEFFWIESVPGATSEAIQGRLIALSSKAAAPSSGQQGRLSSGPSNTASRQGRHSSRRRSSATDDEPVKVTYLADVREGLISRGGASIQAMGWLPLITLSIVSIGMVNTIAASVRARRWEFGILRAVGLTRWGLSRLVICDAILVAITASALSLIFGVIIGGTCLGLVRYVSNQWFEGVSTPLTIPWTQLFIGYALCFLFCFLASLWPAISTGRAEPLVLLKAGRGSD